MRRIRLPRCWLVLLVLVVTGAVGCSSVATPVEEKRLTIGAASDLQFALEEMSPLFLKESGIKLDLSLGSSGNLATQIENGAPIDLFMSADEYYVARLQQGGLIIDNTRQVYAYGYLALAANRNAGMDIKTLQDLLRPDVKHVAIANPDHAPYGTAARHALERAGLWDEIRPKLVYGENIRQALQFVQTGNADAGLISVSIVQVPEVTYVPVDAQFYDPLQQTLAVVRGTEHEAEAREFIALITGPEGRSILAKYGFGLRAER